MRRIASTAVAIGVSWVLAGCGSSSAPLASAPQQPGPAVPPIVVPAETPLPAAPPPVVQEPLPTSTPTEVPDVVASTPSKPSPAPTAGRLVVEAPVVRPSAPAKPKPSPSAVATARATRTPLPTRKPEPQPQLVKARPGMSNLKAVPWDRAEVLADRKLRVHFASGVSPCRFLDSVRVDYRPNAVVVTLYVGSDPQHADRVCAAVAHDKAVDVSLAKPLDGRKILDGAEALAPTTPGTSAVEVKPQPGAVATRTVSWTRTEMVGPRTLRVFYTSGDAPCTVLDRVRIGYAADRITVTLIVGRDKSAAGQACTMALRPVYVDVTLDEPVANRKIVDGS